MVTQVIAVRGDTELHGDPDDPMGMGFIRSPHGDSGPLPIQGVLARGYWESPPKVKKDKVRTPAGVRRFNQPIGTVITPDVTVPRAAALQAIREAVSLNPVSAEDIDMNIFRRYVEGTDHDFTADEPTDLRGTLSPSDYAKSLTKAKVALALRNRIRARKDYAARMDAMEADHATKEVEAIMRPGWDDFDEDRLRSNAAKAWRWAVGYDEEAQNERWESELRVVVKRKQKLWLTNRDRLEELGLLDGMPYDFDKTMKTNVDITIMADFSSGSLSNLADQMYAIGSYVQTAVNNMAVPDDDFPDKPPKIDAMDHFVIGNAFKVSDIPLTKGMMTAAPATFEEMPFDFEEAPIEDVRRETALAVMVRNAIDQWAESSNSEYVQSLGFQYAVNEWTARRFGDAAGDDAHLSTKDMWTDASAWYERRKPFLHMFLDEMYEVTQRYLKSKKISAVRVHRGMTFDGWQSWMSDPESRQGQVGGRDVIINSTEDTIRMNPASSWAAAHDTAEYFASWSSGYSGRWSSVFTVSVPAEAVLSLAVTGIGALDENEIVLLGYDLPASIEWIDPR